MADPAVWAEFLPAFPALVLLLVGYGTANVLFWNRSLLLAFNQPGYPLRVMLWCGLIKVLLSFWVIPTFGFSGEAALLSAYLWCHRLDRPAPACARFRHKGSLNTETQRLKS